MFLHIHVLILLATFGAAISYDPTWESLDSRPLPKWYDEAKIGIFLHWGLFSVPSFGSEWFWKFWKDGSVKYQKFMQDNYKPGFKYQDFAPQFTAEFFDPEEWADIFARAGAQYVVLVTKHHEGYTLWPSKYSWNWNAMDTGPGRDLVGDLATAIRKNHPNIHFGVYHSLYDWYHPLYLEDKKSNFATNKFVTGKTLRELEELVLNYKPEIIWSDGDWEAPDTYWKSREFLAWLFSESPVKDTVVVNDRWGKGIPCHHGSFYNCKDRFNPGVLQTHKWENCMTLDKHSWGYRREAELKDYFTIEDLLKTMAGTVSCGGNLLVNAGPTHDGKIPVIMENILMEMGEWLGINGKAIYKSNPWKHQNDTYNPHVWYTQSSANDNPVVYAIVLKWPEHDSVILGAVESTAKTRVTLIGHPDALKHKMISKGLEVVFPQKSEVISKWAFVLQLENVSPK